MKFKFYYKGNKSKNQIIKCNDKDSLMKILTISKAELLKKNILKDIDFSDNKLMCEVDGKVYNMKELWNTFSNYKFEKDKVKNKDSKKKKKDKTKKKDKKKKNNKNTIKPLKKEESGLIHISRKK